MIKALSCSVRKYLAHFHMLTVKAYSKTALFREWSNQIFDSLEFWKYISSDENLLFQNG